MRAGCGLCGCPGGTVDGSGPAYPLSGFHRDGAVARKNLRRSRCESSSRSCRVKGRLRPPYGPGLSVRASAMDCSWGSMSASCISWGSGGYAADERDGWAVCSSSSCSCGAGAAVWIWREWAGA